MERLETVPWIPADLRRFIPTYVGLTPADGRGQFLSTVHPHVCGAYVVALHLADINGLPCYAVENGWYWVQEGNVGNLAGLLRISQEKAEELMSISKEEFAAFVESQKPRWKSEAIAAIEKYNLAV